MLTNAIVMLCTRVWILMGAGDALGPAKGPSRRCAPEQALSSPLSKGQHRPWITSRAGSRATGQSGGRGMREGFAYFYSLGVPLYLLGVMVRELVQHLC